jgi:ribose transport system substrate-binding protein
MPASREVKAATVAIGALLCLALALGLSACGGGGSSSSGSSSASAEATQSTESTESGSVLPAAVEKDLAKVEESVTSYPAPGPPIKNAKELLAGKTVWYIPVITAAPAFAVMGNQVKEAVSELGGEVKVCDGKVNPSDISTCLKQAAASHPAGIITDAIPVPLAEQAYAEVIKAGVPIVGGYQEAGAIPATPLFERGMSSTAANEIGEMQYAAQFLTRETKGKGNILYMIDNSTDSSTAASEAGLKELESVCSGCTINSFEEAGATDPNVVSAVSSAILKNPGAEYLFTPYEAPSGPSYLQAIQQSGGTVKYMGAAGDPSGFKRIAEGSQIGDVGANIALLSWNNVDALLRLINHEPAVEHEADLRVFNEGNVPTNLSTSAWEEGEWYGNGSFREMYRKLWGLE